jgi:hypothetical protein
MFLPIKLTYHSKDTKEEQIVNHSILTMRILTEDWAAKEKRFNETQPVNFILIFYRRESQKGIFLIQLR